jgi:sugar-specific transcriptional regulator TrmB
MEEIDFSELGLTQNEVKVYSCLVEHGKLGAGEISKFSQVSYSRIYDVLASLEQKGFVKIIPEKSKKFVPSDPNSLIEVLNKKEETLEKMKEQVKKMKEFYDVKEKNPVILGFGKPAFYKLLKEMKPKKKVDYSIKYTSEYRPEWERSFIEGKKKGIDIRDLSRFDDETRDNIKIWLKLGRKIKIFENDGVAMSLKDEEVLICLIKSNMTLLIRDKPFAKIMKQLFTDSYKNAEDIIVKE